MKVAIACDHGGFPLKAVAIDTAEAQGHEVLDLGTDSTQSVDYPDFSEKVGRAIQSGARVQIEAVRLAGLEAPGRPVVQGPGLAAHLEDQIIRHHGGWSVGRRHPHLQVVHDVRRSDAGLAGPPAVVVREPLVDLVLITQQPAA